MAKIFRKIGENSFEAGPGGGLGSQNVQPGWGTPSSPDIMQDPDHFASSDESGTGSLAARQPERPDRKSSSGGAISPGALADKRASEKPMDPNKGYEQDVDQLFTKKITPSPDEIMLGIQTELGNMVKKDKAIAKQTVINNLKKDPTYYSRLGSLNIDDEKMTVDELLNGSTKKKTDMIHETKDKKEEQIAKTKAVLDEMIAKRNEHRPVQNSPEITNIFKELWNKRHHISDT